jgi:hypothetical protein
MIYDFFNFQNDIIIFMIIIDYNNASINSGLCFHQQKTTERAKLKETKV